MILCKINDMLLFFKKVLNYKSVFFFFKEITLYIESTIVRYQNILKDGLIFYGKKATLFPNRV